MGLFGVGLLTFSSEIPLRLTLFVVAGLTSGQVEAQALGLGARFIFIYLLLR